MAREEWRQVSGLKNYEVSSFGRVRHVNGEPRKLTTNAKNHYAYVTVRRDGKAANLRVHRLVAEAFIPNPDGKKCVNHLDGDKTNNRVENLAWCTHAENEQHKVDVLGKRSEPPHITKRIVCLTTGIEYQSIQAASVDTGVNYRHIGEVAAGKRKTAGGLRWGYIAPPSKEEKD